MAADSAIELTPRQREVLAQVVQEYVQTGQPVGSKHLVERAGLSVSPSTVRNELAELEERSLSTGERTFLDAIRPAFLEVVRAEQRLYVGSTAGLLEELPDAELGLYRRVLATLEKRAALLAMLGQTLDPLRPFVRVGDE